MARVHRFFGDVGAGIIAGESPLGEEQSHHETIRRRVPIGVVELQKERNRLVETFESQKAEKQKNHGDVINRGKIIQPRDEPNPPVIQKRVGKYQRGV